MCARFVLFHSTIATTHGFHNEVFIAKQSGGGLQLGTMLQLHWAKRNSGFVFASFVGRFDGFLASSTCKPAKSYA